ncbi:hypothetical protein HN51_012807 [Arachis hypogaea]
MMNEATDPPRRVLLISAGASHSVALLSGNVVCSWGRGEDGQLGHGDTDDRLLPTKVSALEGQDIVSITCGADHTVAHSVSGKGVYSWGWYIIYSSSLTLTNSLLVSFFPQIEPRFMCRGDFGRLGHGDHSDLLIPHPITALHGLKVKQIACGDSHCLALTTKGEVLSWGRNQNGQLGLGTANDSLVPQKVQEFQGVAIKMVAAGAEHSAAITEDGVLYGWGWGRYGNLGLGDRNDRSIPERVTVDGEKMIMVACGWRHTICVSCSGAVYTTGWSKYGQLGHGDFEDCLVPCRIQALNKMFISQVSGGWRHTMALTSNGLLFGWGWNKFGQVGVGHNFDCCCPMQVKFPQEQKVSEVACGWRHTIAVTQSGNLYSWGRGANGQLGHGETIDRNCPMIIEALSFDGSFGQNMESSSNEYPSSGKGPFPLSEKYAVVPDENGRKKAINSGMEERVEVEVEANVPQYTHLST